MGTIQFKTQAELEQEQLVAWRESAKVSRFQAEQALADFGYLAQVETLMDAPETSDKAKRAWKLAGEVRRMSPNVLEFLTALELTDEQADQLFQHASSIEA